MNDVHLHLLVNHFPIIGTIFGLGILIAGLAFKNNMIKNISYVVFMVSALFAVLSMVTGEGAEDVVEKIEGVSENFIETHEELAEKFALIMYVLGVTSLLGLWANSKNHIKAKLISFIVLAISLTGVIVSSYVGTSGGEIRHTEIRKSGSVNTSAENNEEHEEEEE